MSNDHDGITGPAGADPSAERFGDALSDHYPEQVERATAADSGDTDLGDTGLDETDLADTDLNQTDLTDPAIGATSDLVHESADDDLLGDPDDPDHDDAELTSTGDDAALVGAGAVAAGSARAAARRSAAVRAGVTEKKGRATTAREDAHAERNGLFARLGRFFREVVAELRKVIWPGQRQMITYTVVVVVFVAFMIALVWALDLGFAKAVLAVFG